MKRVLIVAQQIEPRARIARVLHTAGYAVELAESRKRAIELVTGRKIDAAIIVHSADLTDLARELREIPVRTMVLGQDEMIRPDRDAPTPNRASRATHVVDDHGLPEDASHLLGRHACYQLPSPLPEDSGYVLTAVS